MIEQSIVRLRELAKDIDQPVFIYLVSLSSHFAQQMRVCDAARMNAYSKDLRVKVVDAVDRGIPRKEVTRIFGISLPTIERYLRRRRQTEDLTPKPSPGRTPTIGATIKQSRALWEQLESNSAATLERHCELWEREQRARFHLHDELGDPEARIGGTKKEWEPPSETKPREALGERR